MMILRSCDGCWFIIVALLVSLYHSLGYGPSIHSRWRHSIHNTGYYRSINSLGLSLSSSVSIQQRSASTALFSIHVSKSKQIILFTPNNLRVHDNPCFNHVNQLTNGRSRSNTDDGVYGWNDDAISINDDSYLLLLNDPDIEVDQSCVRAFRRNVRRRFNTSVHVLDGDLIEAFDRFQHQLCNVGDGSSADTISIVTTEVLIEPNKSKYEQLFKHISLKGMRVQLLKDCSLINDDNDVISDNYRDHSQRYQSKRDILQPIMDYSFVFPANHELQSIQQSESIVDSNFMGSHSIINDDNDASIIEGEDLAIALVSDYLSLGDDQFIRRYQDRYIDTIASSPTVSSNEHRLSLCRLRDTTSLLGTDMSTAVNRTGVVITSRYSSFFQGEVLSGLLSPLLSHGCISTRLLYHCRQVLFPGLKGLSLDRPLTCRVREEAIRRDWHHQLVRWNLKKKSLIDPVGYKDRKEWVIRYTSWRGYVQREATMLVSNGMDASDIGDDSISSPSAHQTMKPILLLIHGFGGSINQYTGLARQLCDTFDVYALDSLGFGQTEKPPLSYNQYLWRDQLLEYLERVVHERRRVSGTQGGSFHDDDDNDYKSLDCSKAAVFIAGNSIGGFFASSLAASIRSSSIMRCDGLILFNPSGDVLGVDVNVSDVPSAVVAGTPSSSSSSSSTTTIALEADYSPYKGPSSELLRLFGKLIFSLLQPRIAATCQWLYPSNKQHVITSGLADNIYRDSCDPGAADVIASGGKLPTPLTINDFFRIYEGPVLLAQGALDPLNNATQRALSFGAIRGNVSVDLLPLGHCPMDENPTVVASSIVRWMNAMKGGSE